MGGCLKGESEVKKKDAKYTCAKCGAAAAKEDHLCQPEKVVAEKKGSKDKKEKDKKVKKDKKKKEKKKKNR